MFPQCWVSHEAGQQREQALMCLATTLHCSWVCAGQLGPHVEKRIRVTLTPGTGSPNVRAPDSGGVRAFFVLLLSSENT